MSDHGATGTSGQRYFSDAEWEAFQQEDVHAGKAVVGLMISIFSMGLLLYIGVVLSIL